MCRAAIAMESYRVIVRRSSYCRLTCDQETVAGLDQAPFKPIGWMRSKDA